MIEVNQKGDNMGEVLGLSKETSSKVYDSMVKYCESKSDGFKKEMEQVRERAQQAKDLGWGQQEIDEEVSKLAREMQEWMRTNFSPGYTIGDLFQLCREHTKDETICWVLAGEMSTKLFMYSKETLNERSRQADLSNALSSLLGGLGGAL